MVCSFEFSRNVNDQNIFLDDLSLIFNFAQQEVIVSEPIKNEIKKTKTFFSGFSKNFLEDEKENLSPNSKRPRLIETIKIEEPSPLECEQILQVAEEVIRDYFTVLMPTEWFAVSCENHVVKFNFPANLLKENRLIYIIKNKVKGRYLIGKTGNGLRKRCGNYLNEMKNFKDKGGNSGRQQFLRDFKANPTHFEVGVLYVLDANEDLNELETLCIDCKRLVLPLYNDRRGGGGGLSHAEENPLTYAIPRPETGQLTPEKCYRYIKDELGQIRLNLTPRFKKKIQELMTQDPEKHQGFYYIVRHIKTGRTYIGTSGHPDKRVRQHGYKAEYGDPTNEKYDLDQLTGKLHEAMGEDPEGFEVGLLPIGPAEKISPEAVNQFIFLKTIQKVEEFLMYVKQSFAEQGGFNCQAGGGPIAAFKRKGTPRRLCF